MRFKQYLVGTCGAAFAAALAASPAAAQNSAPQGAEQQVGLSEIIVTAQKREERLQEVPIAITAIGSQDLAKKNVMSVYDLNKISIPGLVTVPFVGLPTLGMNIRGISTQDPGVATIEAPTALYIDGVYIPRAQGLGSEVIEVERLEVLRGPQGTLFGRNAEGGALSITSKKPTGRFEGRIGGELGDFGLRKGYLHLNLPAFGNISTKFDGYVAALDGYTKNGPNDKSTALRPDQRRNFGQASNWGIRGQALWQPSDQFSALIAADYSDLKNAPTYLHFDRASPIQPVEVGSYKKQTDFAWYVPYIEDKVKGVMATLTYNVSDNATVKSITSYRDLESGGDNNLLSYLNLPSFFFGFQDPPGTLLSGLTSGYKVRSKSVSQEVQLLGNAGDFQYVIGAFYFRESAKDRRANVLTLKAVPGSLPVSLQPIDLGTTNEQSVRSSTFAVFAQATWAPAALGGKLKITPGLRYTEATKSGIRTIFAGATLANPIIRQIPSVSRFDPALTIAYDFTPDINVYARYAQAFRDGGVTVRSNTFSTFGAEINKQVELGFKSELFDRKMRLNLAAFHSWIEGQQISITPIDDATAQEIINVPKTARIWGLEGEATIAPTSGLTISTNFSIMDGKQPAYPCVGCDRFAIVFLPKFSGGVTADYTVPIGDKMNAFIHADYKYMSSFHASPKAFPGEIWNPSKYNVLNARAGVEHVSLGPVSANISAFVENLANDTNIIFDTNLPFQTLQLPRRFGVAASVDF